MSRATAASLATGRSFSIRVAIRSARFAVAAGKSRARREGTFRPRGFVPFDRDGAFRDRVLDGVLVLDLFEDVVFFCFERFFVARFRFGPRVVIGAERYAPWPNEQAMDERDSFVSWR